ncbi:dihydrodipicolinate synthase family protein [Streptomyces sp. NPDC002928]|uniref:dihydrodipicolinate synthase family protein n=1 Tax=Streptomyces sp. NPDC002928 TaxID=3154440 RepID=UPI0033BE4C36
MSLITADDVKGIFPPLITPMTVDEELNMEQFRVELAMMLDLPLTGLVIGGSTGEGYALTPGELAHLTETAVKQANGALPVVTGIITTTTRDATARAVAARDAGASGLMVTPPIYQRPSIGNLLEYYGAIHRASGLPIIIYNVLTGMQVPPATIRRLADLPGVIGTKESAGSTLAWLSELVDTVSDRISVTWATDDLLYPGLALGAVGTISGATSLFPRESLAMFDSIQRNDYERARGFHYALAPVMREVMCGENWPGLLKATFNLLGRNVGPARSPFTAPPADQLKRLEECLAVTCGRLAELMAAS